MDLDDFIDRALTVPYRIGRSSWKSADCWGIVELYYEHILDIKLKDRGQISPSHAGLQAGFDASQVWQKIEEPEQHCLVIMKAGDFEAGHVGVYVDANVLHSDESINCAFQPLTDPFIQSNLTCFLRHV